MKTKKAIILLDQPYTTEISELEKSVTATAIANNFEVIKSLQVEDNAGSNCGTLYELIGIVTKQQKPADLPISVIIKEGDYASHYSIITTSVLGTLETSDLIDIYIYHKSKGIIERAKKTKFLYIAWIHLVQLLRLAEEKNAQ